MNSRDWLIFAAGVALGLIGADFYATFERWRATAEQTMRQPYGIAR